MDGLIYREADHANTVLLIHSNDNDGSQTFTDSKNSRAITANGNVKHTTAQRKFGASSIYFDGVTDSLSLADNADWDPGSGAFTIDFWVRMDDVAAGQGFVSHYTNDNLFWGLYWLNGFLNFRNVNGAIELLFPPAWSAAANIWYHIALIRGWGGDVNNFSLCVNGVSIGTGIDASCNIPPTNSAVLYIGYARTSTDSPLLRGYIDEFRIVKGAAVWTANFTPPKGMYL